MRERLRQFKGELRIESKNSGTQVWVTIPISQTPASEEKGGLEPMQTTV
jgi:signal transduction histidine kinase